MPLITDRCMLFYRGIRIGRFLVNDQKNLRYRHEENCVQYTPYDVSNFVLQYGLPGLVLQNDRTSAKADRVCYIVVLLRMKPGIYYYLDACRMNCFTPSAALPTFQ